MNFVGGQSWLNSDRNRCSQPFTNPVNITDDRPITRRYIFALQDQAIPPALQRKMAGATAVAETAEIDSDHMVFFSKQAELVDVLDRFARS